LRIAWPWDGVLALFLAGGVWSSEMTMAPIGLLTALLAISP
jgi:hypothetical protein